VGGKFEIDFDPTQESAPMVDQGDIMTPIKTRGFAAVGLVRPKNGHNLGGALRAAYVYDAAMIAIQGMRVPIRSYQDVTKAYRSIPVLRSDDLFDLCPYDTIPVAVDLVDDAESLIEFIHPERAFYIFGPEDGTLSNNIVLRCKYAVMIPTRQCMNLAATVNVVLYDRLSKAHYRSMTLERSAS
jgi:tRNA(Leu) C34 or U34 (ribose-2'-O)-methylase TrmL